MHRIFDVTLPLTSGGPAYPGDPPFERVPVKRIAAGDAYNLERLALSTHAGTHVDAPRHFVDGAAGVDELPLDILMGKARVLDLPSLERIDRVDLEKADLRDDIRLLIKTRLSAEAQRSAHAEPVHLSPDAATYLVQAGLKLVGIDSLSVDGSSRTDFPAHRILLGAGVVIVEGLRLAEIEPGDYDMICLPLRLPGADGSPARVVLRPRP